MDINRIPKKISCAVMWNLSFVYNRWIQVGGCGQKFRIQIDGHTTLVKWKISTVIVSMYLENSLFFISMDYKWSIQCIHTICCKDIRQYGGMQHEYHGPRRPWFLNTNFDFSLGSHILVNCHLYYTEKNYTTGTFNSLGLVKYLCLIRADGRVQQATLPYKSEHRLTWFRDTAIILRQMELTEIV
jgi:hypothetical protein